MYHIPDDKRAKRSAGLIFQALIKCMKTKRLSDITARDIQEVSGVSRATYYRLFGNNIEVLEYGCRVLSDRIIEECPEFPSDENTLERFCMYVLKTLMANSEILEALDMCGRSGMLLQSVKMNGTQLKRIRMLYGVGEVAFEYFINTLYNMLLGVLTTWIQRGRKESAEEITAIFLKLTGIYMNMYKDSAKNAGY